MAEAVDELLAYLATRPDDAETQRVYADALSERGELRGELIALELAGQATATPEMTARIAALRDTVHGAVAERVAGRPVFRLRWQRGFVVAVEADGAADEPFDAIAKLADEPALRLLRKLEIAVVAMDGHADFAPVIAALARAAPAFPCLVELAVTEGLNLGNPWIDGPVDLHDVTALLRAYPRLERLVLDGEQTRFGEVEMTALRALRLEHVDRAGATTLAGVRAPALDDLGVSFRAQRMEDLVATVDAVLAAGFAPTALSLAALHTAMAAVIARASATALAARVRRLGFGYARLDDAAVAALLAARDRWPAVVELRMAERACAPQVRARIARAFGVPVVEP
jgi:uncharacterized protein (TIGR02996 family)